MPVVKAKTPQQHLRDPSLNLPDTPSESSVWTFSEQTLHLLFSCWISWLLPDASLYGHSSQVFKADSDGARYWTCCIIGRLCSQRYLLAFCWRKLLRGCRSWIHFDNSPHSYYLHGIVFAIAEQSGLHSLHACTWFDPSASDTMLFSDIRPSWIHTGVKCISGVV